MSTDTAPAVASGNPGHHQHGPEWADWPDDRLLDATFGVSPEPVVIARHQLGPPFTSTLGRCCFSAATTAFCRFHCRSNSTSKALAPSSCSELSA